MLLQTNRMPAWASDEQHPAASRRRPQVLAQIRGGSSAKCQKVGSRDGVDLSAFSQFMATEIQAEGSRLDLKTNSKLGM